MKVVSATPACADGATWTTKRETQDDSSGGKQSLRALPVLVLLMLVLAAWLLVSGGLRMRDGARATQP